MYGRGWRNCTARESRRNSRVNSDGHRRVEETMGYVFAPFGHSIIAGRDGPSHCLQDDCSVSISQFPKSHLTSHFDRRQLWPFNRSNNQVRGRKIISYGPLVWGVVTETLFTPLAASNTHHRSAQTRSSTSGCLPVNLMCLWISAQENYLSELIKISRMLLCWETINKKTVKY